MQRSASISECGRYRFELGRSWDDSLPSLVFVMLNPSTADADVDDPTIRKCVGFAQRFGYGSMAVANLFAYRATDPAELKRAGYPVHPEEDDRLEQLCTDWDGQSTIVCAWGSNAKGLARVQRVRELLTRGGNTIMALHMNADGTPAHPLYQPYTRTLVPMRWS